MSMPKSITVDGTEYLIDSAGNLSLKPQTIKMTPKQFKKFIKTQGTVVVGAHHALKDAPVDDTAPMPSGSDIEAIVEEHMDDIELAYQIGGSTLEGNLRVRRDNLVAQIQTLINQAKVEELKVQLDRRGYDYWATRSWESQIEQRIGELESKDGDNK